MSTFLTVDFPKLTLPNREIEDETSPRRGLTAPIRALLESSKTLARERSESDGEGSLEINKLVSTAAAFYEKVRYLLDYREEHTIRRSAIERILRRRILIERQDVDGEDLLRELAERQYIGKTQVTVEAGAGVSDIVQKFIGGARGHTAEDTGQLLSFAASEIERLFSESEHALDDLIVQAFVETIRSHVVGAGSERATRDQLYLAAHRVLLGSDNESAAYALFRHHSEESESGGSSSASTADRARMIREAVRNPLQWKIAQKIRVAGIYFHIIRAAVQKNKAAAGEILANPEALSGFARMYLSERYEEEQKRLRESGVRAVAYLFCTKIIAAFIFELPYELFILGKIHYVPLLTNTLFHPALLLVLTRRVASLNDANTERVVKGLLECVYEGKVRTVRLDAESGTFAPLFAAMYLGLILFLFTGVVTVLMALKFNVVSIALFLLFLALVSYFAFRIRYLAQRWYVRDSESTFSIFTHVLAAPIVRTGRWLSQTFSSVNVFVFFMDFILETPITLLLNFSGQFLTYLKEKANELY